MFRWPSGLYGLGACAGALALPVFMAMRMGYSDTGEYDRERNLIYSNKGTYGTAGFMSKKEPKQVLDLAPDIRKHHALWRNPGFLTSRSRLHNSLRCLFLWRPRRRF